MLKQNGTFFSDRKHASDLCNAADSSEPSLFNDRTGSCSASSHAKRSIYTCANLDDHQAVSSELEPAMQSVNSQLFLLLLDSKDIAYCLACLSSTQGLQCHHGILTIIYARSTLYKNDHSQGTSLTLFINLFCSSELI